MKEGTGVIDAIVCAPVPLGTGAFCFFILALKGDADMKSLPKLQKILLIAGVVLLVAALIAAPKYWDYCEMRALKAEFDRFVDVENWPEGTEIRFYNHDLEGADAARVREAVAKLRFDGRFDEERWFDLHFIGTGMIGDGGGFWIFGKTFAWHFEVSADGSYVYQTKDRYAMTNGQELQQVLAELKVKYLK